MPFQIKINMKQGEGEKQCVDLEDVEMLRGVHVYARLVKPEGEVMTCVNPGSGEGDRGKL